MDSKNYSDYSLKELYDLYTKLDKQNNPTDAQNIYEQILIKEKSGENINIGNSLASLSDRFSAALVDLFIIALPIFLTLFLIYGFDGILELPTKYGLLYTLIMLLISQVLYLLVNGRLLYKYGQTVGKRFLEIKIVDLKNSLPELYRSYGFRYFIPALFPLIPFLGGLISLIDILFIFRKDRRCIHDHIAGTKVVSVA